MQGFRVILRGPWIRAIVDSGCRGWRRRWRAGRRWARWAAAEGWRGRGRGLEVAVVVGVALPLASLVFLRSGALDRLASVRVLAWVIPIVLYPAAVAVALLLEGRAVRALRDAGGGKG